MTIDIGSEHAATNDELDLIACCLNGWHPADVDITADEFHEPRHAATWTAILTASETGMVSVDSVRLALGPAGDKAAVWLFDLWSRPVVAANAPALAERIRTAAQIRDLDNLAIRIKQATSGPMPDPAAIAESIRQHLDRPFGTVRDVETIAEALPRVIDQLQSGEPAGLSTPWPDLDGHIHGLAPSRLYVVAGRPGGGKSLLGQNLAAWWSQVHRLPTYFASMEMTTDELTSRSIAQAGQLDLDTIQSRDLREPHWAKVATAQKVLMDSLVHVCPNPTQTIESIRSGARDLKRRKGLGLIVVDYLQIITPRDRRIPREQQVAEYSRGLKVLAKELDVPVVALSQLRRLNDENGKPRRPTMSDLRESGAIEQDADAVLLLHQAEREQPAELLVAKARAGRTGTVPLTMQTHWATIASAYQRYGA